MRHEINFTDEQIEAHFEEQNLLGGSIDSVTFTRDTLDDFRAARLGYAERGSIEDDVLGGHPALLMEGVQSAKGQPRRDVIVIDYGAVRAVML